MTRHDHRAQHLSGQILPRASRSSARSSAHTGLRRRSALDAGAAQRPLRHPARIAAHGARSARRWTPARSTLTAPGMPPLAVRARRAEARRCAVTVWKFDGQRHRLRRRGRGMVHAIPRDAAAAGAIRSRGAPRDVQRRVDAGTRAPSPSSPMAFPILVISRASLAELNSRLPKALPMERFRPNVVIDGVDAYDEDRIHELRAGAGDVAPREALHALLDHHHRSAARRGRRRRAAGDAQDISLSTASCAAWCSARTPSS